MNLTSFFPFVDELIALSGEIITSYYLSPTLGVDTKSDQSVVTRADREAESALRELIMKRYPEHGILGEEWGTERGDAEYVWTLDPIDGTISFVSGVPLFGTLIGLLHEGKPVLGVIHQPVLKQLCVGTAEGTVLNGRPVRIRANELNQATLLTTDSKNIGKFKPSAGFQRLQDQVKLSRTWGDCYGYLLLASGLADIMLDPIMNPWDSAPLVPIIRGAGGTITNWEGIDETIPRSVVAAHPTLHPAVIRMLQEG